MALVEEQHGTLTAQTSPAAISVKNVLFATDFSSCSKAALPYATAISRHFGSTLNLAHVLSDVSLVGMTGGVDYVSMSTIYEDAHEEAKGKLEQVCQNLPGITHRQYVLHGPVWANLAAIVQENGIDLIVLGTHGRTGLGKLLLGSVAEDILRHAPCPVLTVGPMVSGRAKLPACQTQGGVLAPLELELRQILCATNFAQQSASVAHAAVSMAEEFGARLTLLHVIEDYTQLGSRPGPMEEGVLRLQALIPKNNALQYLPETILEFGPASECILKTAGDRQCDMIVLGARGFAEVGSTHLPWSTAHHVIAKAPCPVLTIRG